MKTLLLFAIIFATMPLHAQVFTTGGASQIYWKWRPDIADSCYEFTFVNIRSTSKTSITTNFGSKLSLIYWNECDYGKNYIVQDSFGNTIVPPLNDTLFRITSPYGMLDTMCGYDSPYQFGNDIPNSFQTNSPNRRTLIYRGLIYLPEKCAKWHFAIDDLYGPCVIHCERVNTVHNGTQETASYPVYSTKSNIDSFYYNTYQAVTWEKLSLFGIQGCSMNNLDFPNNNSIEFISPLMYYFPIDRPVEYNPGPYDPDFDSLVISIPDTIRGCDILSSDGSWLGIGNYFSPTDANGTTSNDVFTNNHYFATFPGATGSNPPRFNAQNNPFDTDSTFHLVDSTGRTTFTAKSEMQPLLYYSAKKYRNQKFVNETYFINQFTLINDTRPVSYMRIDTTSLQGAVFNSQGTMNACAGLPIHFDAWVKIPFAPAANLRVRTTADTTLPGNGNCVVTNNGTDSVHLTFSWTPPLDAKGLYRVYVSAKDSNCMPPYHHYLQVYTWAFHIDSCLAPASASQSFEENYLFIYPNPANDILHISGNKPFHSLKLFSLDGREILSRQFKAVNEMDLETDDIAAGMYLLVVDGRYNRKVVVGR